MKMATNVKNKNGDESENMKLEEFRQQESVQYWMDTLATRKQSTKDVYIRNFRLFCEWLGERPDEIIKQRKSDLESDDLKIKHRYEVKLKQYIAELRDKGLAIGTQQSRYNAARSFFDSHYMSLELRRSDAPSGESIGSRILEKAEVRKMIDAAPNLKWRTFISFAKDCGWRIGDIRTLTWGDLNKIEKDYRYFLKITGKRKIAGIGFIGPETVKLLELYRKQREERGGQIRDSSLLFPSRLGGQLTVEAISGMVSKLADMVGANNVTAHSLRKYFRANMEGAGVPDTWIKTMIGKKGGGSTGPYTVRRPKKLLEGGRDKHGYKHGYSALRLEEQAIDERQRRIESILDTARLLGKSDEEIAKIREMISREKAKLGMLPPPEKVAEWLKEAEKRTETNGGSLDCQRKVSEQEPPQLLVKAGKQRLCCHLGK